MVPSWVTLSDPQPRFQGHAIIWRWVSQNGTRYRRSFNAVLRDSHTPNSRVSCVEWPQRNIQWHEASRGLSATAELLVYKGARVCGDSRCHATNTTAKDSTTESPTGHSVPGNRYLRVRSRRRPAASWSSMTSRSFRSTRFSYSRSTASARRRYWAANGRWDTPARGVSIARRLCLSVYLSIRTRQQ